MIKNLAIFLSLVILSCSNDNSYVLNGNIDVIDDTKIYILQADQNITANTLNVHVANLRCGRHSFKSKLIRLDYC